MSEKMRQITHTDPPDEVQIETMLRQFEPQPTTRFNQKLRHAPWLKSLPNDKVQLNKSIKSRRMLIWGVAGFIFVLALVSISFIPSVRAVARQIINSFVSEPSNQLEIQVTLSSPGELFYYAEASSFPLSLIDVRGQVDFPIKEVQKLPVGLEFVGARFENRDDTVTLLYMAREYKLYLTQRPIGFGEDVFSIGASAQIELVNIGLYQGEFVVGGWKAITTQSAPETSIPGEQTNISAIWDDTLPQYTLRWQAEGFIYELRIIGNSSPTQLELITLANELK